MRRKENNSFLEFYVYVSFFFSSQASELSLSRDAINFDVTRHIL